MKFLTSKINLKPCPNCNHWFGIKTQKRYTREENIWCFRIECKSCNLSTNEYLLLDEAKMDWNDLKPQSNH